MTHRVVDRTRKGEVDTPVNATPPLRHSPQVGIFRIDTSVWMTGYVVRTVSNNFSFACVNKLETSLPQTKFTASLVTYGSDLAGSAM